MSDLDSLSFWELCELAGFKHDDKYDVKALAKFYGRSERTIQRMLKTRIHDEMTIKLLKLHIMNIDLVRHVEILTNQNKYPIIIKLLNDMDKDKVLKMIRYSETKKMVLTALINIILFLYKCINK